MLTYLISVVYSVLYSRAYIVQLGTELNLFYPLHVLIFIRNLTIAVLVLRSLKFLLLTITGSASIITSFRLRIQSQDDDTTHNEGHEGHLRDFWDPIFQLGFLGFFNVV